MENKIKIIALFGKSASGKDTILHWLLDHLDNTWGIVSCTTRPPRDYEKDGIDYHFISMEKFTEKILDHTMLEATDFNHWFYGTPIESLNKDKINIGVFNVDGINCLSEDPRIEIYPIYIYADDKVRLLRSLNREKSPNCAEICRRYFTDEKDFVDERYDFDYQTFINNGNELNVNALLDLVQGLGIIK